MTSAPEGTSSARGVYRMHSGSRQCVQADAQCASLQNGYGTSAGFAGRSGLRPLQGNLPVYRTALSRKPPL